MNSFSLNALPAASVSAMKFESFINTAIIVGVVMFVGTLGATIWYAFRYRRVHDKQEGAYIPHNYLVEFASVFGISVWVAIFFLWGWFDFKYVISPRMDEYEVNIIGQQWQWHVQYPNGRTYSNEVFVPVNRPVKFVMTSKDVLHSFFIPEFRIKQDVVPGQFTTLHVTPTLTGDFHIFCAEYCGTAHAKMLGTVHVLSAEDFQKWEDGLYVAPAKEATLGIPLSGSSLSMAQKGEHVFREKACVSCHSVNGERGIGPTVKGLFGSRVELSGGSMVDADENYVRESIMDPMKKVVKGFAPQMPTFRGMLSDEDVNHLIAYLKTLK